MSNDITVLDLDSDNLPVENYGESNIDVCAGVGGNLSIIKSTTDKTFILPFQEEPVSELFAVIIGANSRFSKIFYEDPDQPLGARPDCVSADGIKPDSNIENPVCDKCEDCPNNDWGSKAPIEKSGRGGKLCRDIRRIVLCLFSEESFLNQNYINYDIARLDIPPTSLKNLAEYGKKIKNKGYPLDAVIIRIRLETYKSKYVNYAKYVFEPIKVLKPDSDAYKLIKKLEKDIIVEHLLTLEIAKSLDDSVLIQTPVQKKAKSKNSKVKINTVKKQKTASAEKDWVMDNEPMSDTTDLDNYVDDLENENVDIDALLAKEI